MILSKKSFIVLALLASLHAPSIVRAGKIKDAAIATRDRAIGFGHASVARSKAVGKAIAHGVAWPFKKTYAIGKIGCRKAGALATHVATGVAGFSNRITHTCESFHRTFESPMTTEEIRTTIQELNRKSHTMITFLQQLDTIAAESVELAAETTAEIHIRTKLHDNQQSLLFFNLILETMRKTPALVEQLAASATSIPTFIALIRQQALTYGFTTIDQLDEVATNLHLTRLVHGDVLARVLPLLKKLAIGGIIVVAASGIAYLVLSATGFTTLASIAFIPLQLIISIFDYLLRLPFKLSWSLLVGIWHLVVGNSSLQEQTITLFNTCISNSLPPLRGDTIITSTPELLRATTDCMRNSLAQ